MPRADAMGIARVRVPYATSSNGAVEALGPYSLRLGDRRQTVEVGETDLFAGRAIEQVETFP